jgi:5-(carboxyamino)imidazole ribonucleotide mutase
LGFSFCQKTGGAVMEVAIIMGSDSDWPRLEAAWELLRGFGIEAGVRILSAHRSPEDCVRFVQQAEGAGVQVFIAAAGLAAHLPGVVAAHTQRPVIGLPLAAGPLQGQDALYSVVQMPPGVPVATVGIDNARNAALLAAEILALGDRRLADKLKAYRQNLRRQVLARDGQLQEELEARA